MDDEVVRGDFAAPLASIYIAPVRTGGFQRLIKVRMNFDDKLRESVHEM